MNLSLVMFGACFFMAYSVGFANSAELSVPDKVNATERRHGAGFPMKHFVVTHDNNKTSFELQNRSGVVYQITVAFLFRELAWMDDGEIYLVVNISFPGAAVFLTKCNDYPISLKPNVFFNEYKLTRACLTAEDGCVNLHLIATEGAVDGQISVVIKPVYKWFHVQIIVSVTVSFVIFMLLLRQCANHILRIVYSYKSMDDNNAQEERLA